jgi:hypothetical protein
MTTSNPVITHLAQNSSRISRMLTLGQKSSQAQTAGDLSPIASNFGGQKFQLAAQKMRVLDLQKMGRNLPSQQHKPQIGTEIQAKFADSANLLHLSERPSSSTGNWARVNMVYPNTNPVERSQHQVPEEPGILRQGSVIQKFSPFPAPGQTVESFKAQVQREAPNRIVSTRKPTTPPPARVGPRDRLFSRVQEITPDSKEPETPPSGSADVETNAADTAENSKSPSSSQVAPGGGLPVQRQADPVPAQPKPAKDSLPPELAQFSPQEKPTKTEDKPAPASQPPGGGPAVQRQADPVSAQPKPAKDSLPPELAQFSPQEKPTKAEDKPAPASQSPDGGPAVQRQADPVPAQPKPVENLRPAESAQLASEEKPIKAEEKPAPASQPEVTEAEIDRASLMPAAASTVEGQPLPVLPHAETVGPVASVRQSLPQAKPVQKKSQAEPVSSLPLARSTRLSSTTKRLPIARPTSVSDSSISSQATVQRQAGMSSSKSNAQPTKPHREARPQADRATRQSVAMDAYSAPTSTPDRTLASPESGPVQEADRLEAQPLHQRFEYRRLVSSRLKAIQPAESFVAPRANPIANRTDQPLLTSYKHFSPESQTVPSSSGERTFLSPPAPPRLDLAPPASRPPQNRLDSRQPESHPFFDSQIKSELTQAALHSFSTLDLAAQPNPMELARTAQAPILDTTHSPVSLSNDRNSSLLEMTKPPVTNRAIVPTGESLAASKSSPPNVVQRLWEKHAEPEDIKPDPGPSIDELAEKILPLVKRMMAVEIERSGSLFR